MVPHDSVSSILVENSFIFCYYIFIYTNFSHLGASMFCVAPNALFPFDLYNEEYLEQRDRYLTQCQQQLQQFIATCGPGTTVLSSDE